ncbi:hypothetical protein [Neobacillus drentensis]|uniref:hypothetical protein n=1 Tax=Neobacillus drentensis TaxID=220684 RepID=UPI00285492B8|nr:hypothetical protein [Neobacillus drentensis]MDR7237410.1 hypothetical protein [Neobacillus drentensis]
MQMMIWAISSMIVLMLIITFLPLGYTIKGKLILVLTSFILSLGGLATVSIFPLWQTSLMLLTLVFFSAYFMNNRMGTVILLENPVFGEKFDGEFENPETYYEGENLKDVNLVGIDYELPLTNSSYLNLEKDKVDEITLSPLISDIEDTTDNEQESIDMDISFLLERDTEVDVKTQIDDNNKEDDNLSYIEGLLEFESGTVLVDSLEETLELSPILVEEKLFTIPEEDEQEDSDDSLFDFLLAKKEVAAERDDFLDVIEPKAKISLQK